MNERSARDRLLDLVLSKRWSAYMATLCVLVLFAAVGLPVEVTGPLAEGVGWGLAALLGLESVASGAERFARARQRASVPPASFSPPEPYVHVEAPVEGGQRW